MNTYQTLKDYCTNHTTTLVAVSKTKPNSAIVDLYEQGQRVFGENRVQELVDKEASLPKDIVWHMIGHLQTNKVKHIAPFIDLVHSGDRLSLIKELNKEAIKSSRTIDLLLQIKIAQEDSKYGWDIDSLIQEMENGLLSRFENIKIRGVMGMATFTDDENQITTEFENLKSYFDQLKNDYFLNSDSFDTLSMGMSGDYKLAVASGSNMIRVGSLLFGARN